MSTTPQQRSPIFCYYFIKGRTISCLQSSSSPSLSILSLELSRKRRYLGRGSRSHSTLSFELTLSIRALLHSYNPIIRGRFKEIRKKRQRHRRKTASRVEELRFSKFRVIQHKVVYSIQCCSSLQVQSV